MSIKGTRTEQNLLKAFAGESQARNRYTFFASAAKKEGFEQISALFLETAENEKEPAEDRDGRAAPPRADRAEARERREGRQERGDEVVGELRRHAGRARGKREEVRPEVIVGKALAGEPGIGKRQA